MGRTEIEKWINHLSYQRMIYQRLNEVKKTLKEGVTLIAVSKTKPISAIQEAYDSGQRHFGENKVQEMMGKAAILPQDIYWHFIGHLQTNKVKYIAPFVHLIHSVDSLRLLSEIDKQAKKNNRVIDCLLQFHIAEEETKFGFNLEEVEDLLNSQAYATMKNVRIVGIMGMASFSDNEDQIRQEFNHLKQLFHHIRHSYITDINSFRELSMGMSGDYQIAMEEGTTMIRLGSTIFGVRN
jgi:pyridoxal phosphate enzyme (YggS family)